jgi:hypothetical protein
MRPVKPDLRHILHRGYEAPPWAEYPSIGGDAGEARFFERSLDQGVAGPSDDSDEWLGRLIRRRWRGDVFAPCFVERRALSRPDNNRRCGVLQNIAKSPGYLNAKAGRFVGMDVPDPSIDFLALAASMGVPSERAHDRGAIGAAIARALKRGGPVADGNPNPLKA